MIRFGGSDLHPGSGGAPSPIGPLELSRGGPRLRAPESSASRSGIELCGRRLDWIEALAPGGSAATSSQPLLAARSTSGIVSLDPS